MTQLYRVSSKGGPRAHPERYRPASPVARGQSLGKKGTVIVDFVPWLYD